MRQEPVYRRRRAAALLLLVLVVAAIVLVVRALATPSGSSSARTPTPTTAIVPTDSPTATAPCDSKDLELAVATDHTAFALGSKVPLVVTVTYRGEQPSTQTSALSLKAVQERISRA